MKVFLYKAYRKLSSVRSSARLSFRNIYNIIRYGSNCPKHGQLVYFNPQKIEGCTSIWNRKDSGLIVDGSWSNSSNLNPLESLVKYRAVMQRYKFDMEWEETGVYNHMMKLIEDRGGVDGCSTIEDVKERYENLDDLYQRLKHGEKFKSSKELKNGNDIYIHIGADGEAIFGCGGIHRFAMAKILGLKNIPAELGVVHRNAIMKFKKSNKNLAT